MSSSPLSAMATRKPSMTIMKIVFGDGNLPADRYHHGNHPGRPLTKAAARLVRLIAECRGGLEHALSGLRIDIAAPVQGTRNGPDREAQMPRQRANADCLGDHWVVSACRGRPIL